MQRLLECGALCNDAVLKREGPRWVVEGDPTEGALLVAARRAGMDPEAVRANWPRVAEIAFTSERKKMSTLHAQMSEPELREILALSEAERLRRLAGVPAVLHVKGAPERILAACSYHVVDGERNPLFEYDRNQYFFPNQEMATRALRVIALAIREFQAERPPLKEETPEGGLTFLGPAGSMDAPRPERIDAIR